jgi:hypothetical protein
MNPNGINIWQDFNIAAIAAQYHGVLTQCVIIHIYPPVTPPRDNPHKEPMVQDQLSKYLWGEIDRSLDAVFIHLNPPLAALMARAPPNKPIKTSHGSAFSHWGQSLIPDRIAVAYHPADPKNVRQQVPRVTGDIKVSWCWNPTWRMRTAPSERRLRREYYQVVSQVYTYAQQCHARYFYIITDQFLVCYRRAADAQGNPIEGSVDESGAR